MAVTRLGIEVTGETGDLLNERAELIGISPEELASASVAYITDMPIAIAAGICAAYLDDDLFDDDESDTNAVGEGI